MEFLPHLEVSAFQVICQTCFCSPDLLPRSMKNLCQHLSNAKCLFTVSEQPQSINQSAGKETRYYVCVFGCVCMRLLHFFHLHMCSRGRDLSRCIIQPSLKRASNKAGCNYKCVCLKEEVACKVFDTKGRVCSRHKEQADCMTTATTRDEYPPAFIPQCCHLTPSI